MKTFALGLGTIALLATTSPAHAAGSLTLNARHALPGAVSAVRMTQQMTFDQLRPNRNLFVFTGKLLAVDADSVLIEREVPDHVLRDLYKSGKAQAPSNGNIPTGVPFVIVENKLLQRVVLDSEWRARIDDLKPLLYDDLEFTVSGAEWGVTVLVGAKKLSPLSGNRSF